MTSAVRVVRMGGLLALLVMLLVGGATTRAAETPAASCPRVLAGQGDLGQMAYVSGDELQLVDLATCKVRTLVGSSVGPPVRWSADGRYLAYGSGSVVRAAGGEATRPLGRLQVGWRSGSPGWMWSPRGHRLAGVTAGGGVVVGGPHQATVRLFPDGWGATSIGWSPDGLTLAVSRSLYTKAPAPYHQEIWMVDLRTGRKTLIYRLAKPDLAPPWLSGFSPDGHWLLAWEDSQNSSSLAADGVPLVALPVKGGKPVRIGPELMYGDFLSWCGNTLAYVQDNGGRQVTLNDRINLAGPAPTWPTVTPAGPAASNHLSFISPACSPPGLSMIATAAGPVTQDEPFGSEHRRIWLLINTGGNWLPLEPEPPKGSSDELPQWSSDGRWIAFVRTSWNGTVGVGHLYLLKLGAHYTGHARLVGPAASLGVTGNYYGHYGWGAQIAWYAK